MSEFEPLHYQSDDPEGEPFMRLSTTEGQEVMATRLNTKIFTFMGRAAFNHIFLTIKVEGDKFMGNYIWNTDDAYPQMLDYMMTHEYPAVLNALVVPACDLEAFYNRSVKTVEEDSDFIPEGWS